MPDLSFQIEAAQAVSFSLSPVMGFHLHVTNAGGEPIHTIALRSQIQIEVTRRRYGSREQERLQDLFGEPSRWGQTVRNMLWTHASVVVPGFTGSANVELQVPCTFDFNAGAMKYFRGLEEGEIPLCLPCSGTVF